MSVSNLFSGLVLLKKLDSLLDFARATIQLEVLVLLGAIGKPVSPREISSELNVRLKSVYDALNKLSSKGLVKRVGSGLYQLTPSGEAYFRELRDLFSAGGRFDTSSVIERLDPVILIRNLIAGKYIYDVMMAMALSESKEMCLKDIAKLLGVSEETAKNYVDLVSSSRRGRAVIFKRYTKVVRGRTVVCYKLTELGLQELSRFYEYRKLKRNPILSTFIKLTRSRSLWEAFRRTTLILGIAMTVLLLFYSAFKSPLIIAIAGTLSIYAALSVYFSSKLDK